MECSVAYELIMKYMDKDITKEEAEMLNKHILECESCFEDFKIYDGMMSGFADFEIVEAPEGFESCVMAKIEESGIVYKSRETLGDNIFTTLMGFVAVLFGFGFIVIANREAILNYLLESETFSSYAAVVAPMVNLVNEYVNSFITTFTGMITVTSEFIVKYKALALIPIVILVGVQYFIRRKDKVEA